MSNKLAKAKNKSHWQNHWETFLNTNPNGKPRYMLYLSIAIAVFAYLYHKVDTALPLVIVYGYLSLWIFLIYLHVKICHKDKDHKKGLSKLVRCAVLLFSFLPIVIATVVDYFSDFLVKIHLRSFAKHFPAILIGFIASLLFCMYPLVNALLLFFGNDSSKSAGEMRIRLFIFLSLLISFFIVRLAIKIAVMFCDNVYSMKCAGESSKKNYLETVYDEGAFIYTLFILAANISLKVFKWPNLDAVYTDTFFVSTTIITLMINCANKWKNIHEEKHYNNAA